MFSLGGNCAVSYHLNNKRGPFDWCKININQLIKILENKFLNFENIYLKKKSNNHKLIKNKIITYNYSLILTNIYNINFAHEILNKYEITNFCNKLKQRIERFINTKNPKLIRLETQNLSYLQMNKYNKLYELLNNYFDNFQLIVISKIEPPNKNIKWIKLKDFSEDWRYLNVEWDKILNF